MAQLTLKHLFLKKDGPGPTIQTLLAALPTPLRIADPEGRLLFSSAASAGITNETCFPIVYQDQPVGYLFCSQDCQLDLPITRLISTFFDQEAVKKALASEVLDRYRELTLLFRLSEKLTSAPDVQAVANLALDEACPLIDAAGGLVLLSQPDLEGFVIAAACGGPLTLTAESLLPGGLLGRVLESGDGEIANRVDGGQYFHEAQDKRISILCSPLKTGRSISGAIIMMSDSKTYTAGDLKLLNTIATQTGPVIEMIQLHQFELERARLERDLYNAHKVQADLLPRDIPSLPGWDMAAFWQPARMVGGDFYDFIPLPDGLIGLVVADVADKGMPAALVMANTRSILRAVAASMGKKRGASPGKILGRANDLLLRDMSQGMFVTCLLAVLDPASGKLVYANAGHNLPFLSGRERTIELRATGFPLGLFPNVRYEEKEALLSPGESLIIYSDGLPEAHNPQGEMFDYPRMRECIEALSHQGLLAGEMVIQSLMDRLRDFIGPGMEQEDDVTILVVARGEG